MMPSPTYFCGMAATAFIAVSLAVAAIRWFHMCRPYDRNPHYYYPGRPFVVGVYLNALLLIPFALHPESPDAWYLAQVYFLPVTIYHFALLLYSYFGNVMQWEKWRVPVFIVSLPVVLTLLAAFGMAVWPGDQVGSVAPALSAAVLYVLAVIITGICFAALGLVHSWAMRFDSDDFSNPADFPEITSRRWIVLAVANLTICWIGVTTNSPKSMFALMLFLTASSVFFIITALHPHRTRPVEEEEAPEAEVPAQASRRAPSKKKQQEILAAVHTVVVEQQAYLDAHLTIQDVADRSGYSRSTLSSLFKAELGGFFVYVNRLRLQYMETWLQEHPGVTINEACLEAGFPSRQAYYAVKGRLT